jgi:hypothetical protein
MKSYFIFLLLLFIYSCSDGPSKSEFEKLKSENERLKSELDDCKNGAEKIIAYVEKAYKENNFLEAKRNIDLLYQNHPESPKNKEFKELLTEIEKKIAIEEKLKEEAEKERIRLANINNTGIWSVNYYVDDFGEPTKDAYIRNTNLLRGTFSNTATQNSALNVKILITNSSDIDIMLYEYAGNNPVKAYSSEAYKVLIQDKDGTRYQIRATNWSDRLSFDKTDSRKVHSVLMKGGTVKFKIYESETPTTEYEFTITNADWYENAYRKLSEK